MDRWLRDQSRDLDPTGGHVYGPLRPDLLGETLILRVCRDERGRRHPPVPPAVHVGEQQLTEILRRPDRDQPFVYRGDLPA